jgi:WD40 repeat protein
VAGVVLTQKTTPNKVKSFFLISILFVGIFCLIIFLLIYSPFWRFLPITKIHGLPKGEDILVFTSNVFTNRITLNGPYLFALVSETGSIYDWHGLLHARDSHWTNERDKMLISTGGIYAGEPIDSFILTIDGDIQRIDIYGELSPDGKKIAYLEDFSLLIYDLTTKEITKLTPPDMWASDFSWSPNSNYIAFESPDEVHKESKNFKVMRVSINDKSFLPLTETITGRYVRNIQWSGDGTMLSFDYYASSTEWVTIIMFANGHRIYKMPEFGNDCQIFLYLYAWLHQGSKLSIFCRDNPTQLWILDTKTNSVNLVKEFDEIDLRVSIWSLETAWSANDTKLAFTVIEKNALCTSTFEGVPLCSHDIYIYDTTEDTVNKIPLTHWLYRIQNMEWIRISN